MADLKNILGGEFRPPEEKRVDPPEVQLVDAMLSAGLTPPDHIDMDGKVHRFKSGTKGSGGETDKAGWYVIYGDGIPAGRFGCWRAGIEMTWRAEVARQLSVTDEMALTRRMAEAKVQRDAEREKKQEVAQNTVEQIWSGGMAASSDHPYLQKKGIDSHGARLTGDGRLMVPLYSNDGTLSSLQYISIDGDKRYHPGGATGGKFWLMGDIKGMIYIAEGFATAATIYETTGHAVIIAYSASNIVPVVGVMRDKHGQSLSIVIVADNDASGVGQKYADQAAAKYGAKVIVPPIAGDANDYVQAGYDLAQLLTPPQDDWLIPADSFCDQPAPIRWLVKNWLQDRALIMVHGPSGGGKTFVVLDWCLRISSRFDDWCGNKVRNGSVVYLAGEGHHGLRGRVAAWKVKHKPSALNMWLSKDGCDLNTPQGYQRVVDNVRTLPEKPSVIVVDTLHRFLLGDENSSQDAKTMLDACNSLMAEFDCSVLLVHHTGVSDESQHRARGSSAWRGALDIEISVLPGKNEQPIQLIQRKSKDSEMAQTIYLDLETVAIPGWLDEDGEPVTSAVIMEADAPSEVKKDNKLAGLVKTFSRAWFATGCEVTEDGDPYLSRSGALNFLIDNDGVNDATAKNMVKPSQTNRFIGALTNAEYIASYRHGWKVVDGEMASQMLMTKG